MSKQFIQILYVYVCVCVCVCVCACVRACVCVWVCDRLNSLFPFFTQVALAMSLNLRCFLLLLPREDGKVHLSLPDLQLKVTWTMTEIALILSLKEGVD